MIRFDYEKKSEMLGKTLGYSLAYLIFTFLLFFVLVYLKRFDLAFTEIAMLTFAISLLGMFVRRWLE